MKLDKVATRSLKEDSTATNVTLDSVEESTPMGDREGLFLIRVGSSSVIVIVRTVATDDLPMTPRALLHVATMLHMVLPLQHPTVMAGLRKRAVALLSVGNPLVRNATDAVLTDDLSGLDAGRPLCRHLVPVVGHALAGHEL
jgi:hypothetical protein